MAGNVTLKGPNKLGAAELDEGALTAAVVATYSAQDGRGGQAAAERVLPARQALWRLAEVYLPKALATSLRARLAISDQTGQGGVRELRAALADWLDPPAICAYCHGLIREVGPAGESDPAASALHCGSDADAEAFVGLPSATGNRGCPARPQRVYSGKGRRPAPTPCVTHRGRQALRGGAALARDIARCGTLALFTPLHLDPACAAAARLLRHGASAYDLVVDRDARTLLEVTHQSIKTVTAHGADVQAEQFVVHGRQHSTPAPVAAARRHFDRVLDAAVRANGPLILKCQLRQYSPSGSATRADLVQGAAMGCRRALLDYNPAVARFSTYAIHWMRQGGGEAFARRDLVTLPDGATGLRRAVEERGVTPAHLLRLIGALVEPLSASPEPPRESVAKSSRRPLGEQAHPQETDLGAFDAVHARKVAQQTHAAAAARELAMHASLHEAVVLPPTPARKGVAAKPAETLVPSCSVNTVVFNLLRAAEPPRRAKTDSEERALGRVAAYVAARLGLRAGKKAVTGSAMLTALRCGAAVVVGIGTGDHDDAGDDPSSGGGSGGGAGGRCERLPEHLADEAPDPEEQAAEEDEARRTMAALLAALERLRATDPEAAEVVRRHHGMDALGDPETFDGIAARPLHCTGRTRCREGIRQAYERGKSALKTTAPRLLARLPADAVHQRAKDAVHFDTPVKRHSQPLRPVGVVQEIGALTPLVVRLAPVPQPLVVIAAPRCDEFHNKPFEMMLVMDECRHTPEDFGAWAAGRDAMLSAF